MTVLLFIISIAVLALLTARLAPEPWRGRGLNLLKLAVTGGAFYLLLSHPVAMEDGSKVVALKLVLDTLSRIDAGTFWLFCGLAASIKFIGILASMFRWQVLLRGQHIEFPYRHIFGSFLIGRFIGTFLPSTAGLDGYKLYDASRFSGRTVEVTATTLLEKVLGVTGIFLSFLVALPFGISLFGENAALIAGVTVPLCTGIISALLVVLWYPAIFQWLLENLPIPGKARLEGLVLRVSHAAAAYRDKKKLVVLALALSFVVHFTTAAMYWFTALAIGAFHAEFWPTVLGSSVQILATVLSPFTIAGEGIREAAQYMLLGDVIGPANAIVSAALGFWAAEALTLGGAYFWWTRPANYHPAYCRVDGVQVDYEAAARSAVALETEEERAKRHAAPTADVPPLRARAKLSAGLGFGAGVLGGLVIGMGESLVIAQGGFGPEAQVLWYGPLVYAVFLGGLGLAGGLALAVLPMDLDEIRGWTPSLALLGTFVPFGLFIVFFRVRRDVFAEQMPSAPWVLGILAATGVVALLLFFLGPRLFRGRAGAVVRPLPALIAAVAVVAISGVSARVVTEGEPMRVAPPSVPAALADRPNVLLVMTDTLRADHLSCYGGPVDTPALCSLMENGSIFDAFSHASWTKPATASLLTSLLPSSHGAMSKPAAVPQEVEMIGEVLQGYGYATGGIVSNINLAPSFGFDQGYDEYHYLGPDYLAGASESSSKLILYQLGRRIYFKLKPGMNVEDSYQDAVTVNAAAFDFLDRHRDSRFFLFLHYMDPHDPYFEHPYNGRGIARASNQHPEPSLREEMRRLYRGEIAYLDQQFAVLLDKLRELDLYDDTVIALVADHGEEFYEHGGWWHGMTLYDEQVRVPLLVKWAQGDRAAPQNRRGHVSRLIDVAPTLIARTGAAVPEAMQGIDLASDPASRLEKDRVLFAEEDHEGNVLRALRTAEWKWIEANPGNPRGLPTTQLFHVAEDPDETRDIAASDGRIVADLQRQADTAEQFALSQSAGEGAAAELSESQEDALRALGYIE